MTEHGFKQIEPVMLPKIILASASPRRLALLRGLGLQPEARPADIDETRNSGEPVLEYVARMALEKARSAATGAVPVLGGDTIVCLGEQSFGKPRDKQHAREMLEQLSGREHEVHSAVCLITGIKEHVVVVTSTVTFATLDAVMIDNYIATGEPNDKAGAYAIQGFGASFVSHLVGSYSAVMGLPLFETIALLRNAGIDVVALAPKEGHS